MTKNTMPNYLWIQVLWVIGLFLLLISPAFLSEGLFFDGLIYSATARNEANGIGTFWCPYFTASVDPDFYGHPPLALGLQALWMRWLGDAYWVEKLYSVLFTLLTGCALAVIWCLIGGSKRRVWLPLTLWSLSGLTYWGATNNVLEVTMGFFVALSVVCYLCSLRHKERNNGIMHYMWCAFAGVALALAFMTKGPTGLYPLSLPLWCMLFTRKIKVREWLADTMTMLLGLLLPLAILLALSPDASVNMSSYFQEQLVNSLQNVQTVDSRFYILIKWFEDNLLPVILFALPMLLAWRKGLLRNAYDAQRKGWIGTMLALTLSGVLPIMISMKQHLFYVLTTVPYLAVTLALTVEVALARLLKKTTEQNPVAEEGAWIKPRGRRRILIVSLVICCMAVSSTVYFAGRPGRDKALLADIHTLLPYTTEREILSIDEETYVNWKLHAYMARYKSLSLDKKNAHNLYLLIEGQSAPKGYTLLVAAEHMSLWQRTDKEEIAPLAEFD